MFFALDEADKRVFIDDIISNGYKDKHFYCPVCKNEVIVKNGEFVTSHFSHKIKCEDTFSHDMSEWHLNWQSLFPKENQEIVIEAEISKHEYEVEKTYYMPQHDGYYTREDLILDFEESKDKSIILKHRADVCIGDYVIEFQHSPISADEFAERNIFYNLAGYKVIWIFDFVSAVKNDQMIPYAEIKGKYYNKTKWQWKYASKTFTYFMPEFFKETNQVLIFFQICDPNNYEDNNELYIEQVSWCIHDEKEGIENYSRFITQQWPGNFQQLLRAIKNNKLLN